MPNLLLLETGQDVCSVSLVTEAGTQPGYAVQGRNVHAEQLTLLIQRTLADSGLTSGQLDGVALSEGPGSYTGLRIGAATAKGMCYALDIPLYGINSLYSLYSAYRDKGNEDMLFAPMFDARRMEVYMAVYDHAGKAVFPTEAVILPEGFPEADWRNREILFFGNGMPKCREILAELCPQASFLDEALPQARGLAAEALRRHAEGAAENLLTYEPNYLKDFKAGTPGEKLKKLLHG